MNGPLPAKLVAAVPGPLQNDPGLIFARVQDARRGNRPLEAAQWLAQAPAAATARIDPDAWWSEQRMVARELLDASQPQKAFEICAAAAPASVAARVDADFHAGWIALRFLGEPEEATRRFAAAAAIAATPLSIARAAYWQGRAADALGQGDAARGFYERAAAFPIAYYGQLASERLGRRDLALRAPTVVARGAARSEATRVVEWLYAASLDDLALSLAEAAAGAWSDEAQLAALGEVVATHGDAAAQVEYGKAVTGRGFALDATAFPISGMPDFAPLSVSADLPSVYAIARQESEFARAAASGAGAKGLMQILPSTALSTARRAGVGFDAGRLIADPAYNTQLGAAFLGQLLEDEGGSQVLALAAYNAGAGRVAQWIAAYGDPRSGKIDPVDWVERIPFDETRDYVERVSENIGVYRARFADAASAPAAGDRVRIGPRPTPSVIASEAKQSIVSDGRHGLLRRFAPRNDELHWKANGFGRRLFSSTTARPEPDRRDRRRGTAASGSRPSADRCRRCRDRSGASSGSSDDSLPPDRRSCPVRWS